MKRLRHPITSIREPFGKAGLIVACLALVAALGGTAFAATKLNGTQKKEVEKIAKKFQGSGPAGPAGANGTNGAKGDTGAQGAAGANGKGIVSAVEPEGANCEEGGASFEVEGSGVKRYACNGAEGEEGSPWTAGGTLPKGATETGGWAFTGTEADTSGVITAISFPIRLAAPLPESKVHYGVPSEPTFHAICPGKVSEPKAPSGELCIYEGEGLTGASFVETTDLARNNGGAGVSGSVLLFHIEAALASGTGAWAVTG